MGRNRYFAVAALLLACGNAANTANPTPVAVPPPSAAPALATAASSAPAKEPDFDLAIGETIELEGTPLPGPSNPTGDAIDFLGLPKNKLVVFARATGLATLNFTDPAGASQSRSFRVTEITCRKTPLHPAIVLARGDRAAFELADVSNVDTMPHQPVAPASASYDGERVHVYAQNDGHVTVMAHKKDHSIALYDVFVGPACADRHYASIAAPIPPGLLGPKGDGTCQRTDQKRVTAVPCPDVSKLEKMPKEAFSSLACEWIGACDRQGYEGCCVGCTNAFAMKLDRGCALKALRQKTCADVVKIVDAKGCLH